MCLRNNERSLPKTFESLEQTEKLLPSVTFVYHLYENDSNDATVEMIDEFMKHRRGVVDTNNKLNKAQWDSVKDKYRIRDMAIYRNKMKSLCTNFSDSKYSIILDSEIEFTADAICNLMRVLDEHQEVAMTTPWGISNQETRRTNAYFDVYALRLLNDKRFVLPCLIDKIQPVKSAFAGLAVVRTHVLEVCDWTVPESQDGSCSEHVYFCERVREHGSVVICKDVKVRWGIKK